ncbi:EamA family transporter RarD [Streptomyces sp. LX-29]|uniref:EamA family transporter RarD n=1 Tax=Streptomyces sp. LX-29 TaxID=2900152 RepID=UPI00240DDA5F|nr:EamA family transporter RarD [Streptomyces sp. LX-29]WFB08007.1 EamA family transporter RarD [Streptomyces sp. LX-29]
MKPQNEQRAGLAYGFAAYGMWGLFPLYWPLLEPAGAAEILAHRMAWSLIVAVGIVVALRRWSWIPQLLRQPKRLASIALASCVISLNWGTYIWGVNSGYVVETSLGYFINPLVSIGFGVLLLRERLRPAQWTAVGIGLVAVVVLAVGYGRPPWIALILAFSFGTYSLVKKRVGLDGLESFAAETSMQFLPALAFLLFTGAQGDTTFAGEGVGHALLLMATGAVTAVPLICFGASAVRLPLSTIGLMQYLAPTSQFALGLLVFHESMPPERWAGFALVWLALTLLTWDALRTARQGRLARARARAEAETKAAADATVAPAVTATATAAATMDTATAVTGTGAADPAASRTAP